MRCKQWHDENGESHVPYEMRRLMDGRGLESEPPYPAYMLGFPPANGAADLYLATDLCPTCKADIANHYR